MTYLAPARQSLRILMTLPYFPYPTTSGGKLRAYGLLTALAARGHRITLLSLTKEMPSPEQQAHLSGLLERLVVMPRRSRTDPRTLLRAACSLRRPAVAAVNGCDAAYSAAFEQLLGEGFDVVHIDHSYAFEPFAAPLARRRVPFVLSEHNIESDVVAAQYQRFPPALRRIAQLDAARCRIWERDVLRAAACVVAVAEPDRRHFAALGARATALVVNSVDVAAHADVQPDFSRPRALFIGNYEYSPNTDAVTWLCQDILPHVWASAPELEVTIAGHAMPQAWAGQWGSDRLRFAGFVPSVTAAHAACSMFLAPLRMGGGSKLKVLEAMASGLPVVGTAQAMSGLDVTDGESFVGGESAEAFARGIVMLARDPATARRIGEAGRDYVAAHHSWQAAAAELEQVFSGVLERTGRGP